MSFDPEDLEFSALWKPTEAINPNEARNLRQTSSFLQITVTNNSLYGISDAYFTCLRRRFQTEQEALDQDENEERVRNNLRLCFSKTRQLLTLHKQGFDIFVGFIPSLPSGESIAISRFAPLEKLDPDHPDHAKMRRIRPYWEKEVEAEALHEFDDEENFYTPAAPGRWLIPISISGTDITGESFCHDPADNYLETGSEEVEIVPAPHMQNLFVFRPTKASLYRARQNLTLH